MDSVTQAALGAAVGGLCLGRRLGRSALLLGAAVATLPDLDALVAPHLGEIARLTVHRAYTHTLLFIAALSVLLASLLHASLRRTQIPWRDGLKFCAACLLTAVALDCFTAYGVPLLRPFVDHSLAIASIAVVDPLYTVPLLLAVAAVLWRPRWRRPALTAALALSTLYLGASVAIKLHMQQVFAQALKGQGIEAQRLLVKPTLFNTVLWHAVAEDEAHYWVGFRSLLDRTPRIEFRSLAKGHEALADLRHLPQVRALGEITAGYYQVLPAGNGWRVRDIRYGTGTGWLPPEQDRPFVFVYRLWPDAAGQWHLEREPTERDAARERESARQLWRRIRGET